MRVMFDSAQTAFITGATLSQIEHLVKSGVVVPLAEAPRRGMSRQFSIQGVIYIAVAMRFVRLGVPVRVAHAVLAGVREDCGAHLVLSYEDGVPRCQQLREEEAMAALRMADGCVYINIGRIADRVRQRAALLPLHDVDPGMVLR